MAILFKVDFERMGRKVAQRTEALSSEWRVLAEDAVILLQLIWVQLVQDSVAVGPDSKWRVPGTQPPINYKTGKRNKNFSTRPPAERHTLIASGGDIGWRAYGGDFSSSLRRFRIRREAFKIRMREIVEAAASEWGR